MVMAMLPQAVVHGSCVDTHLGLVERRRAGAKAETGGGGAAKVDRWHVYT